MSRPSNSSVLLKQGDRASLGGSSQSSIATRRTPTYHYYVKFTHGFSILQIVFSCDLGHAGQRSKNITLALLRLQPNSFSPTGLIPCLIKFARNILAGAMEVWQTLARGVTAWLPLLEKKYLKTIYNWHACFGP